MGTLPHLRFYAMKFLLIAVIVVILGCKRDQSVPVDPKDLEVVELSPPFEEFLISKGIDSNPVPDGSILYGAIKSIDSLNIDFKGSGNTLTGLERFSSLRYLKFRGWPQSSSDGSNQYFYAFMAGIIERFKPSIAVLDVSQNRTLEYLDCSGGSDGGGYWSSVGAIKFGNNDKLRVVKSNLSMFKTLDITTLTSLEELYIDECMSMPDVSVCTNQKLKKIATSKVQRLYISKTMIPNADWRVGSAQFTICK
jgi:hypothetical protein